MNATSLMVLDLEDEQIPPSDIIVYMVSTALDAYEKDEININIKISGYEYFNSSKVNMEFDAYSPITNGHLIGPMESVRRGSSFMLSGSLEGIDKIQVTYITFVNAFTNHNNRTTEATAREIMTTTTRTLQKRKRKEKQAPIRTRVKIPRLCKLAIDNNNNNGECSVSVASGDDNSSNVPPQ